MCVNGWGSSSQAEISRSICRHCSRLSARRASMWAGWRSVRPMEQWNNVRTMEQLNRTCPCTCASTNCLTSCLHNYLHLPTAHITPLL